MQLKWAALLLQHDALMRLIWEMWAKMLPKLVWFTQLRTV